MVAIIGCLVGGFLLDKYKKYKFLNVLSYGFVVIIYASFTGTLHLANLPADFILMALYGLFMGAYSTISIQLMLEITYPESEGNFKKLK